ncbi:MAG: CinA family nicotinamide mononucleotide deamidase-related protein [Desulfobacula sp.]|nr:CinA family nicotinamide mononucleotide deamidase-related protein [Desulfobacula sp.]
MIVHILSTGDEVVLGDIADTNAAWLCRAMKELGLSVQRITAVGDEIEQISSVLREISGKADICLVTGGLGPTSDDVTALAFSRAAGVALQTDCQALASMQSYFKKRGYELTQDNEKQALLPVGSQVLTNHAGTAPGFYRTLNRCLFFFMPGVPAEMKLMLEKEVVPVLKERYGLDGAILLERLTVFGLGESRAGSLLNGFHEQFPGLRLGFRADFPVIEVKIILPHVSGTKETDRSLMDQAKQWAMDRLENKVVSDKGLSLAQEVGRLLSARGKTLAIAESCTGGLISSMMTDVAGSSDYFLFSAVTYSNEAKIKILNVREKTLLDHGAVHERTALEMAEGVRLKTGADFGISTTGIAGPGGGSPEKPVGMVCVGLAGDGVSLAKTYRFTLDDRAMNKTIFAHTALDLLRRHLTGLLKAS